METDIIITANSDLRSECNRLGLNKKLKVIKCIASVGDAKPTSVSSTTATATAVSTIMKHAFLTTGRSYFYATEPKIAVALKLGVDTSFSITSYRITNATMFDQRLRMTEVVAALTKYNASTIHFEDQYREGLFNDVSGPIMTKERIDEAYCEFVKLVMRGISKHSHPAHFQRISRDRGICAVGITECVERI
jgi:hypothetical protein